MKNYRFFLLLLTQLYFMNGWSQGFGKQDLINEEWSFHLGDIKYAGVEYFDHSQWRKVDLPHDWSVEETASPQWASCTGYLPGGIGWYRKDLNIPVMEKGKQVFVYFEGVYNNSEVFINGKWIGKRPNGYISFMYDLTPYIHFGGRNVLAVKVDHSDYADSRWYTGSGIYRDVHLVYANPVHIGLWGVSYTAEVQKSNADILIHTEVENSMDAVASIKIVHELYDKDNKNVGRASKTEKIALKGKSTIKQTLSVSHPVLWSIENPYLYTLKTFVYQNGKLIDKTETKTGIRTLTFDADKGFALNGESMKVKGVCIHHDAGCLGSAVPKEVWKRRLMQLKAIGCNAIRMSHNPQATCVYDLCDELGLLVKDEAFDEWEYAKKKWITGWNNGEPGFQGSANYFREWNKRDLADMIRRDRNHPSIIMWSIGNEVDYPNDPYSHPVLDKEGISQSHVKGYQKEQPRAERLGDIAKELVAEAKKYDLSRPVTAALAGAVMSNETDYPGVLDIVGYNYTENRYKQDHEKYPLRVLYGSETRHDLDAWKAVRDNDYIFGQFIWTGLDYLGEAGKWPSRGFTTGMIDLAGNIKPNGYFRKALWDTAPMAYLGTYKANKAAKKLSTNASPVWNYEKDDLIRVVTYTNCEEAELKINGKTVGERKPYDDNTAIISWDIPFEEGTLEVIAYKGGKKVAGDLIRTSGRPFAIKASFDKTEINNKNEAIHLDIQIVDEKGIPVVLADNEITCQIDGDAKLLGLESGDNNVADNYRDNKQRCKNGRLTGYILSTSSVGNIRVRLKSPLLKSTTIDLIAD